MIITFFKSEWETHVPIEMSLDTTWESIVEILTTFVQVEVKEDTEMYNLWSFKETEGMIHRCKDDCLELHGLVLDYDKNLTLIEAVEQFTGFECIIYTTFNHNDSNERFRVVIPFTKPMPIDEFNKKRKSMIESFPGVDRASFSRSQAIFLHSGKDKEVSFSAHMAGMKLDWGLFQDEEIIEYVPQERVQSMDDELSIAYRTAVIESLKTCKGFRHMTALNLVIILKSCGANFADYCAIVARCGDQDSCIHEQQNKIETWSVVQDDVRIRKEKRDAFIKKHGGNPITLQMPKTIKQIFGPNIKTTKIKF